MKRLKFVAGGAVVIAAMGYALGGSLEARRTAPVPEDITCLPTCAVDDGRFLVVAGDDPTTLASQAIVVGLNFDQLSGEANGNFDLFDGDREATNWDTLHNCGTGCAENGALAPELIVELYADPAGIGPSGTPIATWTPGAVPSGTELGTFPTTNNAWNGVSFVHDAAALNGTTYQYALSVRPANPSVDRGWNAFKIRAAGTVLLLGNQVVGFIGAMNVKANPAPGDDQFTIYPSWPSLAATTYDGTWVFKTRLPSFLGDVTVFDGDMDFGNAACTYNDTDDADSSGTPPFAIGSAAFDEGIAITGASCTGGPGQRTGVPAEDVSAMAFARVPTSIPAGIAYSLVAPPTAANPAGQTFLNQNPSGNKEWEQFKVQKVTDPSHVTDGPCPAAGYPEDLVNGYPASDCRTTDLPGGVWEIRLDGMDLSNLNFWFFSFKVEPITTEYSIGRLVWYDTNENGVQDGGELGIPGVAYTVYDAPLPGGNVVSAGVTDGNGEFLVTGLPAGSYTVVIDASNFAAAAPLEGLTSTTGGETEDGVEVGLPVCVDTNDPVGCGDPIYAEAIFGYVGAQSECPAQQTTVTTTGSSSGDGTDGNTRTFDGIVRASAWSRNRGTGVWSAAYLGAFAQGLGVTDNTEGSGSSNRHLVDNNGGTDNYVLYEFASPVTVDQVQMDYIQSDSDITVWIGTKADAFTAAQTLSDAYLAGLTAETNDGSVSSGSRWADINPGVAFGNVLVVASRADGSSTNDKFKLKKLILGCPPPVPPCTPASVTTTGSTSEDGTDGNTMLFNSGSIRASAWSRNKTSGAWAQAYLGAYSSGLGVTDPTEATSAHRVDNAGTEDNYILFEFQTPVVFDAVELAAVSGDSDISVWIGTVADSFVAPQTLSDAYLTALGFTEVNDGSGSSRTANINAGNVSGNVVIISAQTGETNDAFKIKKLTIKCPTPQAPAPAAEPVQAELEGDVPPVAADLTRRFLPLAR